MKKAFLTLLLGVFLASSVATAAFAEFVYVTQFGKKYHNAESKWIKDKEVEKLTLEEAEERGYEPSKSYLRYKETQLEASSKE